MILDDLAAATRRRIEEQKKEISPVKIREIAESMERNTEFPFEKALGKPGMSFICEVKKASPSKGIIAEDFPYLKVSDLQNLKMYCHLFFFPDAFLSSPQDRYCFLPFPAAHPETAAAPVILLNLIF